MRENMGLYRGKRKDNGEWVEGAYYKQTLYYGDPCEKHYIITSTESLDYDQVLEYYEVDPETVGEHIGMTDKKGKKIFEGDVIRTITFGFDCDKCITEIKFGARSGVQGFYLANGSGMFYFGQTDLTVMDDTEVIGNRFDNPELLQNT